jgi:hypothetical protein
MVNYLIRVEMHGATYADYERLHSLLAAKSVTNFIWGDNKVRYRLPTAMYTYSGTENLDQVRAAVVQIAAVVKPKPSVIVTVSGASAWEGLIAA